MRAPGFFDLVVLRRARARPRWLVLTDPNPPSAPNRLVQTEATRPGGLDRGRAPAQLRRSRTGTRLDLRQAGRRPRGPDPADGGREEFLLLLVDTATGEVVLSSYAATARRPSSAAATTAFARGWEKLCGRRLAGPALIGLLQRREALRRDGPAARRRPHRVWPRRARRGLVRRVHDRAGRCDRPRRRGSRLLQGADGAIEPANRKRPALDLQDHGRLDRVAVRVHRDRARDAGEVLRRGEGVADRAFPRSSRRARSRRQAAASRRRTGAAIESGSAPYVAL